MSEKSPDTSAPMSSTSIRQSILTSFQTTPTPVLEPPTKQPSKAIKIVPYINVRHVLGVTALVIWPIILGTAFNIYGFEEASSYLEIRLDVKAYQERVEKVQNIIDTLVAGQKKILVSLSNQDGQATAYAATVGQIAVKELADFDAAYPEIAQNHQRVTPAKTINKIQAWLSDIAAAQNVDPTDMMEDLSTIIKEVRMFFSAFHTTSLRRADTWNNILQQLFISEVLYRLKEVASFGEFAYSTVSSGAVLNESLRLTLLRRYQRVLTALDLYSKYSLPQFLPENLQKACSTCNFSVLQQQNTTFLRSILPQILTLDNSTSLQSIIAKTRLPANSPASSVYSRLLSESLYPIDTAHAQAVSTVSEKFENELDIGAIVFAFALAVLIGWLVLTTNLLGLVTRSLAGIFSESYRFQWVQLCRRRAIEREKSRSDKIVAEMFFEMNFKYLYEGNLPPTVLYKEATIAFVELLQYEELCKIYTTVDHVAILDWYYHLVSASVKGFNTNLVATAGHYCLLAGTHAYHAENVALTMLRLMTLVRESFLPPPHNTKLPLIRAGIHTGPVAGAIVSLKFPLFTMLGDTVNTAARMNSKSKPYCVLLSETSNTLIAANFTTQSAGTFNVKGKGQMNTYWLLSCKWKTFEEYFVNLNTAESLRKIHDLEGELAGTSLMHHRRTGFGRTHGHSVFEPGTGRRRSSSVNDGSIGGLGGDLLQNFIRSKKRRKSKRTDRHSTLKSNVESTPRPAGAETGAADNIVAMAAENAEFFVEFFGRNAVDTARKVSKPARMDRGKLSAKIEVRASPNESYYVQISNNVHMRSWNRHAD